MSINWEGYFEKYGNTKLSELTLNDIYYAIEDRLSKAWKPSTRGSILFYQHVKLVESVIRTHIASPKAHKKKSYREALTDAMRSRKEIKE